MIHRHFSTLLFLTQLIYEVEWKFTLQLWKLKTVPAKLGGWELVVGPFCPTFPTFCSLRLLNDTCDKWKNPEPCCQLLACTLVVWPLFWERCSAKSCCWICGRTSILRPSNTVVELSGRITPFKLKSPLSIRLKKHSGSSESFLLVTHVKVDIDANRIILQYSLTCAYFDCVTLTGPVQRKYFCTPALQV